MTRILVSFCAGPRARQEAAAKCQDLAASRDASDRTRRYLGTGPGGHLKLENSVAGLLLGPRRNLLNSIVVVFHACGGFMDNGGPRRKTAPVLAC